MESRNRERVALSTVVFAALFAQAVLYAGLADLVEALGAAPDVDAGMWFLAAELTAYVVFAAVWGALSDATGRRVTYVSIACVAAAVLYLGIAAVPSVGLPFEAALALRLLQGAAAVGALSLGMTMLMDLEGGHGRNMGAAGLAIGAGVAVGVPAGGAFSEFGALTPLYVSAALMVAAAAAVSTVVDRAPDAAGSLGAVFRSLTGSPVVALPYAFGFVDRFTAGFFALVGTFYFRETFALGPAETGVTLAFFFAPFALLQYPFGLLSDRVGRAAPIVLGSLAYGVGVVAVGLAPSLDLVRAGLLVVGALGALVAPATMALVTDLARPGERGAAMGGFNIAGSLGFLAGVVVGGSVASRYDYLSAFVVAGGSEVAIALLATPVFVWLSRRDTI